MNVKKYEKAWTIYISSLYPNTMGLLNTSINRYVHLNIRLVHVKGYRIEYLISHTLTIRVLYEY